MPQNILKDIGGLFSPKQRIVQITNVAESEEVTNQEAIKTVVRSAIIQVAHFTSNNSYALNIACVMSILTASTSPPGPSSWRCNAVAPKTMSQKNPIITGKSNVPAMYSLIVLPLEILAMNIPTKGPHDIHQPQ